MNTDIILRLCASLMPRAARARYLEEWRADSRAAAEAGLRPGAVARGAAMLVLTIDRDLPAHTNEPRGALPRRLARRGLALFAAALVVLGSTALTGGGIVPEGAGATPQLISTLGAVSWLALRLALAAIAVGALYVAFAATVARTPLAKAALLAAAVGPLTIAGAAALELPSAVLAAGILLTIAGGAAGLIVVAGTSPLALEPRSATRAQRICTAGAGLAVVFSALVLGAIDLLVWNPQAKAPGLALEAVYTRMLADDGFQLSSTIIAVAVWAVFWGGLATVVAMLAARRSHSWMTPRRIAVVLLLVLGGAVFFRLFAGFSIGMSLADTFATSGRDSSIVSALLEHLCQLALVAAAVLLGWAPKVKPATALVAHGAALG